MVKKRSVRQRVERLQAAFKPVRSAEISVVDELIAEGRGEAQQENQERFQGPRSGRKGDEPDSRG